MIFGVGFLEVQHIEAGEVQDIDGHDDNRKDWIVAQSPCGHEKAPVVR